MTRYWMAVAEVARITGLSRATVRRRCRSGGFLAVKDARGWRIDAESVRREPHPDELERGSSVASASGQLALESDSEHLDLTVRFATSDLSSRSDLAGADFSGLCLVGADFSGSVLKDADFSGADLSHARFVGADLYRANFSEAVLYATEFGDANLTRAAFNASFPYGWLLRSPANISHADVFDFAIEPRRRTVRLVDPSESHVSEHPFGGEIGSTRELCTADYRVGKYCYQFERLESTEREFQRSQVWRTLKRIYLDLHDGQTARYCYFNERYHQTRSRFRHSPLTSGASRVSTLRTVTYTAANWMNEKLSGYGVRPSWILRNAVLLLLMFVLSLLLVTRGGGDSGILFMPPTIPITGAADNEFVKDEPTSTPETTIVKEVLLQPTLSDAPRYLEYALIRSFSPETEHYRGYGVVEVLGWIYFLTNLALIALLLSSMFTRLLTE